MAFESVRGYVQLATGLGDLTRARATEAAQGLLSLPNAAAGSAPSRVASQVSSLADELMAAATTNRENLLALVRSEIDAAVLRLGLARASELEAALERISVLRSQVAELRAAAAFAAAEQARGGGQTPAPDAQRVPARASKRPSGRKTTATTPTGPAAGSTARQSAKKAPARKVPAKSATTRSATTRSTTAQSPAAKKAARRRTPAAPAAAKKTASKKAGAKKTASKTSGAKKAAGRRPSTARTSARRTGGGSASTAKRS